MMPETAGEWLTLVLSALALGTAFRGWLNSTATENSKRITDLQAVQSDHSKRLQAVESERECLPGIQAMQNDHSKRLQAVEGEMKHLPDKDGMHRLEMVIADLKTDITRVASMTERAARTADRVENYLLEKGQK